MAQKAEAAYRSFVKGLITEANQLTFPDNASIDEANFVLNRDGSRARRLGVDYESSYVLTATGLTATDIKEGKQSFHIWESPGGDTSVTLGESSIPVQNFFELNSDLHNLSNYQTSYLEANEGGIGVNADYQLSNSRFLIGVTIPIEQDNGQTIGTRKSLVSSLAAPRTSPVIPPKLLVDRPIKNNVTPIDAPKSIKPVVPPITTSGIIVITPATANLLLSFMICMNGELEPVTADFPILAINTIENLARISLSKIA